MYELILSIANDDERIHAVYMNGSRVNKNIKNDIFQDYDIVYVVNETSSFIRDKKWIENFGGVQIILLRDYGEKRFHMYRIWLILL